MKPEPEETISHRSPLKEPLARDKTGPSVVAEPEESPGSPGDDAAALEKIRDLLFGEQARQTAERFEDLGRYVSETVMRTNREMSERTDRLAKELDERFNRLSDRLAALESLVQESQAEISNRIDTTSDDLSSRMSEQSTALQRRIAESRDEAISYARKAASELEESKAGRETLSALLIELASRVKGR